MLLRRCHTRIYGYAVGDLDSPKRGNRDQIFSRSRCLTGCSCRRCQPARAPNPWNQSSGSQLWSCRDHSRGGRHGQAHPRIVAAYLHGRVRRQRHVRRNPAPLKAEVAIGGARRCPRPVCRGGPGALTHCSCLSRRRPWGVGGLGLGAPSHTDNAPCRAVVPVSRVKVAVTRRVPDPSTTMSVSTNLARRESHGMV
jgi:hypothetical protein